MANVALTLAPQDWRLIVECMQRCRDELTRQMDKGHLDGCSGTAWYMSRLCHGEIVRLLPIVAKAGRETV